MTFCTALRKAFPGCLQGGVAWQLTVSSLQSAEHNPPWDFFFISQDTRLIVRIKDTKSCSRWGTTFTSLFHQVLGGAAIEITSFQNIHTKLLKCINFTTTHSFISTICCCLCDLFNQIAIYNVMEYCLQQIAFLGLAQNLDLHSGTQTWQKTFWGVSFLICKVKMGDIESVPWDFLQFRHCFLNWGKNIWTDRIIFQ